MMAAIAPTAPQFIFGFFLLLIFSFLLILHRQKTSVGSGAGSPFHSNGGCPLVSRAPPTPLAGSYTEASRKLDYVRNAWPQQMTRLNEIGEIRKVQAYVRGAQAEVNKLEILPRVAYRCPFDIVALATISKGFALSRACIKLLNSQLPDEAYGLSRSLVECAANLRFLTANPIVQDQRTRDFARYALANKAYWLHYALEVFAGKAQEPEIRRYAKQQGIAPDDKLARRHWSGEAGFVWAVTNIEHPLDGPVTPKHKKVSYAADYYQTSTYVHCSSPAIDAYCPEEGASFRVSPSSTKLAQPSESTLFVILINLHNLIAYALFGMNLERPARLNTLFQKTLNKMKPIPRRHRGQ